MDKRYKHLNGEERGVILAEHLRRQIQDLPIQRHSLATT